MNQKANPLEKPGAGATGPPKRYGVPLPAERSRCEGCPYDLPVGETGAGAVQLALSRLGDPYSQERRGQGDYTDCSYLVQWVYRQLGVKLTGTAAEQGKYCANNGLTISKSNLAPGDLVFWSHKVNGRYINITHVGIYAGDGKVVDASSSRGQVVYRNLFDADKQYYMQDPMILIDYTVLKSLFLMM